MDKERFYVDTEGDNQEAYRKALQFGCKLAGIHSDIKRVILLVNNPQDTSWFDKLYGPDVVKKLFEGVSFKGCKPLVKIETLATYKDDLNRSDIVITCGLDSDEVSTIDSYIAVKVIVAIPFIKHRMDKWLKTWSPKQVRLDS